MSKKGAICGGVISKTEFEKRLKNGTLEGVMMAFVMPDKFYERYMKYKYAWSII